MGRAGRRDPRDAGRVVDLRPRVDPSGLVVPAPGRRQRHLQDLRRRREQAGGVQAAGRDRQRGRLSGARVPHADGHHRRHAGALPEGRRADRRRGLLDRRVPGLLPRADALPAQAEHHQRAGGHRRRAGVLEVRLVGERRQLTVRDGLGAGGDGAARLGDLAGEEGAPRLETQAARSVADARRRAVVLRLLELLQLPLRELRPYVGHVPLLRRLEVLQRAVVRPPLRVRRGGRRRGAGAEAPGRAAQDHEPAHQHDGRHQRGHGRPDRDLQGPLHAGALGRLQTRRRLLPEPPRHQALGGGADRSRLQRLAGLEHRRHDADEPGADQRRPGQLPHQDRSVLHLRDHPHVLVGVRLADHVRRAGGVRHQLPVTLLLDGRLAPALGLAVLSGGGRLPGEEGAPAPGRVLPRLFDAAADLPALHLFGPDPGDGQTAVGQGRRVPLGNDARGRRREGCSARTPPRRTTSRRRAPGGSRSPGTRGRRSSRGSIAGSFRSWRAGRSRSPSWSRSAW